MSISGSALDALYIRYGFTVAKSTDDLRVYVLRQGYLYGADIVPLADAAACADVEKHYQSSGYATHVRHYSSLDQAASALFEGFFATQQTAEHLRAYYARFAQSRTKSLGFSYQYIPCPYSIDGNPPPAGLPLVRTIANALDQVGPQLLLIEAAAGFGKTCAAYELLSALVQPPNPRNPIFAELSRNRQARVFRYVLLDEIDRSYPSLSSTLVQHEIQQGRVPLIIDGFDELLSKRASLTSSEQPTSAQQFENVESMLDTIGDLLVQQSKIVLTTRRTAIFAGEEFQRWVLNRSNPFTVVRVALSEPSVADWIGSERAAALGMKGVRMDAIGNPVLLGFIRNMTDEDFGDCCQDPNLLTRQYFRRLLDREQRRQDLRISPDGQLAIFRQLAKSMVQADITADSRAMLSQVIAAGSQPMLEAARATYSSAERPTVEELADKLTGHALLDRVGRSDDIIGFVNEFVFGTLIGDNIMERTDDEWCASELMFNCAVTAFRVRNVDQRCALWRKLKFESDLLDESSQLMFDLDLCDSEMRPFQDATITDIKARGAVLGGKERFSQTAFVQCAFHNVEFVWPAFAGVGFVNCSFYDCTFRDKPVATVWNRGCRQYGCDILASMERIVPKEPAELEGGEKAETTLELLRQFWPTNHDKASSCMPLAALVLRVNSNVRPNIDAVLGLLETKGLLKVKDGLVLLNEKRIGEIASLLKRQA
jgi:hypothetical protein